MVRKRRFGRVRRLPSGRWQVRYKGPDGIDHPAPNTFVTKADAERWLALTEADIIKDNWLNPDTGRVLFADYARAWVAERPNLSPKTFQLYEGLARLHLVPGLGSFAVADITEPRIRRWRKTLLDSGVGPVTVAKSYRLLRAIMNTAVDDGLIRRNPCRIKGAGQEKSPERPVLTMRQIFVLADSFADRRYRLLVLLAVFCSLRWGELAALRRTHIDTSVGLVRIEASVAELADGSLVTGPPKSLAGARWVSIPAYLLPDVVEHLDQFTGSADHSLIFCGPKGAQLRRSNFTRQWRKALEAAGLTGIHFHDLRHTGNMLAGEAGANLRELMDRMGHSTTRAAYIYQHRTSLRDKMIADQISKRAEAERPRSGT
ncbi:site-specific integrase [Trebonia sp.]|uniref:tyrosine-type recombinase/integrase n=1 Tax=Trebonia sp. TaxID=2767075 RepID=UPI00261947D6|nr:site-specific integrase [Trebonia sp.]